MDAYALIFAVVVGVLVYCMIGLYPRWAAKRFSNRLVARLRAKATASDDGPNLKPESDFTVVVSDTDVRCSRPDGSLESVRWNDLQKIEILTTDEGPFAPDVFWVLHGSTDGCVIPWGATGESQLLDRLQALPDFRNDVVMHAAGLTTRHRLLCWQRAEPNAEPTEDRTSHRLTPGGGSQASE